ncbi:glycoside hydrolase family 3 protein [Schaalia sp. ZJ405]|nr:glycoside hydrolase family 3 protein [Schaalia sp. ZJ405]
MHNEGNGHVTSQRTDNAREIAQSLSVLEAASLLAGRNEWESRALPERGIPSFIMSDGPHGVRRQTGSGDHLGLGESEKATCFPTAATVANSWDPQLAQDMGAAIGQEARALGVDVLLGPGINIKRSPLCGRNFEYYSEDPLQAGRMAAGFVRGIQSQGVSACPKHFAVNSQELRRMASDSVVDERTMREIYLTAFEIVVREAHPQTLMSSYNLVNGTYAHENAHLLLDILRQEWGFDGMVVSDWGGSNRLVEAARNGGSLEMPVPGLDGVRAVCRAVKDGSLPKEKVYDRAAEVIRIALGAQSHGERPALDADPHHALARRVSEESSVLMRNEDQILPLAAGTTVAFIGDMAKTPRYQGSGSSQVNPTRLETTLDVAKDFDLDVVGYAQGYDRQGALNASLISEAVALAKRADVVIAYIGLDELSESEGLDREHMRLPQAQIDMLEAVHAVNPRIVAVVSAGSSFETTWASKTQAILHTSLSGQAGASAALRILTGAVNPSGRLSETYPVRYEDNPTSRWYPATQRHSLYREGLYVGYRYFTSTHTPVAFPFGFGLSYSTFQYSQLTVDEDGARFTVTNTSTVDGSDVPQLYVRSPKTLWGPAVELKGFSKVHVPAGQSVEVTIPFDSYTFRHFSIDKEEWAEEGGEWQIGIGHNVNDIVLTQSMTREGVTSFTSSAYARYIDGRVEDITDVEFEALLGLPLPQEPRGGVLTTGDPLSEMSRAKSRLARAVASVLAKKKAKADATGKPDLGILFVTNMPFRALEKMSMGNVSAEMVDGIVELVNGHTWTGLKQTVGGFFRNRRANRQVEQSLKNHVPTE